MSFSRFRDFLTNWPAISASLVGFLLIIAVAVHVAFYVADPYELHAYPGPLLAKLSHGWLGWVVSRNSWSTTVEDLHKKYGPFVRLAPDHISVADPSAIVMIYGHASGALKAPFYDAFSNFRNRNIFTTRSRTDHARKRRIASHIFATQSVLALESTTRLYVQQLIRQWDTLCMHPDEADPGRTEGMLGDSPWKIHNGRVWFDSMPWFSFWSFDTISDLALGSPFGMLTAAKDIAKTAKSNKDGMKAVAPPHKYALEMEDLSVIQALADREEASTCLGHLPAHWHPIVSRLPQFKRGNETTPKVAGLSVTAVARRLARPETREDLLGKLLEARDDEGNSLSPDELSAEAFVLVIAGADTTANTSCAITYYLAREQHVQAKLQAELDAALGTSDDDVFPYEQVKNLPYLDAVINEGLRLHTTVGGGLPRLVPAGGMTILGHDFKEGTWVSVPTYSMHRNEAIWGENATEFYPERWLEADADTKARMQQSFVPFSVGPRACIGRNLALMQLHIILATIFRRYTVVLESDTPLQVHDSLIRKPERCIIGMKRRFS